MKKRRDIRKIKKPPKTNHQKNFDTYLQRASHIAQVVIMALALAGMFFTVIPLYQKALLEEAISKKEIQLKAMDIKLEESYIKIRDQSLSSMKRTIALKCTTLLQKKPSFDDKNGIDTEFMLALEFDNNACIYNEFTGNQSFHELKRKDQETLKSKIKEISTKIDLSRQEHIQKYKDAALINKDNIDSIELSEFTSTMLNLLRYHSDPEFLENEKIKAAISSERAKAAYEFENYVMNEISRVNFN